MTDVPSCTNVLEYEIKVTGNHPIKLKSYPVPYAMIDQVTVKMKKMLKSVVIEESNSLFSSPFVIVKKKEGTNRFCIDFRALIRVTVFDAEPMPNSLLRYWSKIDLCKGYWQIRLSMETKHIMTAFQTTKWLFQFKILPFGMVNSGASFSRMMRKVLKGIQNVDNFVDDILIFTDTFSQHVKVLDQELDRLVGVRLTSRPSKCFIGYRQLECLSHTIGQGKLLPGTDKIEAVRKASKPETKKQVRRFLGLANFYWKFVPNFAHIAYPLTELTKKWEPNGKKMVSSTRRNLSKINVRVD